MRFSTVFSYGGTVSMTQLRFPLAFVPGDYYFSQALPFKILNYLKKSI